MEADWSVACGADDPTVVVPWTNRDGSLLYIDLQNAPDRLNEIPEAAQYPCIATALLRWNRRDSPLFTAKCDVWSYGSRLFDAGDIPGFADARGSYIDLFPRDATIYTSFAACEKLLRDWTKIAQSIALPQARCEWTLRPARILPIAADALPSLKDKTPTGSRDGFATSLYVWGYGASPSAAAAAWSTALLALVEPIAARLELSASKV